MPFESDHQLVCRQNTVELTVNWTAPHLDSPDSLAEQVHQILFQHQMQFMLDSTLLDPDQLEAATAIICRSSVPEELKDPLLSLGFSPQATESGGREQGGLFQRFSRNRRSGLDKWLFGFERAAQKSEALGAFEASLIEDLSEYTLCEDVLTYGSQALANAARTCFRTLLNPDLEGLRQLESLMLAQSGSSQHKWVLHPAAVLGLSCFVSQAMLDGVPGVVLGEDEEGELRLNIPYSDQIVQSDPEYRVVQFVCKGRRASLSSYAQEFM